MDRQNHANLLYIKGFDLNLLTVFEMVFLSNSVSRVAAAMGTTTSAVSQSLQKLRLHFDDPLFVRDGRGISPTALGVCLHEQIAQGLSLINHTLNASQSVRQRRKFVIFAPCCVALQVLPAAISALERLDMGYELLHHSTYAEASPHTVASELLNFRKADVVFSTEPVMAHSVQCLPFFDEPLVLVCRDGHPRIGETCTEAQLAGERFVMLQRANSSGDRFEHLHGGRVVLRSDSFISLLGTVSDSDLLTFLPRAVALRYGPVFRLHLVGTAFAIPSIPLYVLYNKFSLRNPEFRNLLDVLLGSIPVPPGDAVSV